MANHVGLGVCFGLGGCRDSVVGSPWASGAGDVARYRVECALGAYSLDNLVRWDVPGGVDGEALALALSQHPCQGVAPCKPLKLLNDGDLLHLVENMLDKRGLG